MTYGEVISVIEESTRHEWDRRYWELAQKADNPVESYNKMVESLRTQESAEPIENLTQEQQDWLRKR